jgi:arsenate reductase (thioredoxin)
MDYKPKIIFLCTGNSCRSQMAEGWVRHLKGNIIEPYSAGVIAQGLNTRAVRVMKETGVDISQHFSKDIESLIDISFDHVITVCSHAKQLCPVFPGKTRVTHVSFDDPPSLAKFAKSEEEALSHFRRVRDEIRIFIEKLPLK